jgi:hypothetical protein
MTTEAESLFWELAPRFLAEDDVDEGTLMGRPCLRAGGEFLATVQRKTARLVVKLDADRVEELVNEGLGLKFAPAGKVFREWVAVPTIDAALWEKLIEEALAANRGQT